MKTSIRPLQLSVLLSIGASLALCPGCGVPSNDESYEFNGPQGCQGQSVTGRVRIPNVPSLTTGGEFSVRNSEGADVSSHTVTDVEGSFPFTGFCPEGSTEVRYTVAHREHFGGFVIPCGPCDGGVETDGGPLVEEDAGADHDAGPGVADGGVVDGGSAIRFEFARPSGACSWNDDYFVVDQRTQTLARVAPDGTVTVVSGAEYQGGPVVGSGSDLVSPQDVACGETELCIADGQNITCLAYGESTRIDAGSDSVGSGANFESASEIELGPTPGEYVILDTAISALRLMLLRADRSREVIYEASGQRGEGLAVDRVGSLAYFFANDDLMQTNLATGETVTLVDFPPTGPETQTFTSLALDLPNGQLLASDNNLDAVWSINLTSFEVDEFSGGTNGGGPGFISPVNVTIHGTRIRVLDSAANAVFDVDPVSRDRTYFVAPPE